MAFINDIQTKVERSIFESIRGLVVAQGYLPDISNNTRYPIDGNGNLTLTAQTNWNQDINTIVSTKGWALELFGASEGFSKGLKASPRIVVVSKRIMPGEIGLPPGFLYDKVQQEIFTKYLIGDNLVNMHFDIHLISITQEQSRFLNVLMSTVLGIKKYLTFYDDATQRFFIKYYNYYQVTDPNDGEEENIYSYEVQDLYMFEDMNPMQIVPITSIDLSGIILGYFKVGTDGLIINP